MLILPIIVVLPIWAFIDSFARSPNYLAFHFGFALVIMVFFCMFSRKQGTIHRQNLVRELNKASEQLRLITSYVHDGVCLVEYDPKQKTAQLKMCNDSFVAMAGFSREELLSAPDLSRFIKYNFYAEGSPTLDEILLKKSSAKGIFSWERPDGAENIYEWTAVPWEDEGKIYFITTIHDITAQRKAEQALQQKIIALTQPVGDISGLRFEDLFDLEELQQIQDTFAAATGLAAVITDNEGRLVTKPANFCRLCNLISSTEKGLADYSRLSSSIELSPYQANIKSCFFDNFLIGGAPIQVGGMTVAKWFIGQVFSAEPDTSGALALARELGLAETEFLEALAEAPRMSRSQFEKMNQALLVIAKQISNLAMQNLQQARDIAKRIQAEEALKESEERYRTLFNRSPDAIFLMDPHNQELNWPIIECNEAACTMNGYSREELIGKSIDILNAQPTEREDWERFTARIHREKKVCDEKVHRHKDGSLFLIENNVNLITVGGRELALGIDRDITERVQAEETIWHQANHDLLTGLPNRALFSDRLSQALASANLTGKMVAVLYLDLDRFKTINDTLGHKAGDRVLQMEAERLSGQIWENNTIARLGGDEFVLLLPQVNQPADVGELAQKILETSKQPLLFNGQELYITVSMGIALYPNDGTDGESLLKNSDTALNRAKKHGGNNYQFYAPAMNAKASERLTLENSLRRALNRGEFLVYYQPQLDIKSWEVSGFEALVRWKHPERGLVSPAEFIPVAEETGLIKSIDEMVLRLACAQNKTWLDRGFPRQRIAVNL